MHLTLLFLLTTPLADLDQRSDGTLGACYMELPAGDVSCVNGDRAFSLQSVMKLFVAAAVLEQVDRGKLSLSRRVYVHPRDVSPGPRRFSNRVRKAGGLHVTVEELLRLALQESDSTATDVLLGLVGGPKRVQAFLDRKLFVSIRVDRTERQLQMDVVGIPWTAAMADPAVRDKVVDHVPARRRRAAWNAYRRDPRDRASPRATVLFLSALAGGHVLSGSSTHRLLTWMEGATTGRRRLRAGLPKGYRLAHKTGTSSSWKGLVAATNDVGVITTPSGRRIAVAAFLADARGTGKQRAAVLAKVAEIATTRFQRGFD